MAESGCPTRRHDYQGRFKERLNERKRIARELHDALLQSVQGLDLSFHAAARQILAEEPARQTLELPLDRADEFIVEGRDPARDLRNSASSLSDLPEAFPRFAEASSLDGRFSFQVVLVGALRDLHPLVLEETNEVGREALRKALGHSQGANVEVDITYDSKEFLLRVRDEGKGIDAEISKLGGCDGQ
ncbi:MAG TPA: histidine kinase [Candidatus Eisenbacteria bacterium]|nr:histidine kinase [Candidatus Eisenbacteria bacterium]